MNKRKFKVYYEDAMGDVTTMEVHATTENKAVTMVKKATGKATVTDVKEMEYIENYDYSLSIDGIQVMCDKIEKDGSLIWLYRQNVLLAMISLDTYKIEYSFRGTIAKDTLYFNIVRR